MKVAELQLLLTVLSRLFAAAGATKQNHELTSFVRDLEPFASETLSAFVKLADKGKNPPKPVRSSKAAKENAEELSDAIYAIYDRPTGEGASAESVAALTDRRKALKEAELGVIADRIGLYGKTKLAIPKLDEAIGYHVQNRIGTAARRDMTDRPPAP